MRIKASPNNNLRDLPLGLGLAVFVPICLLGNLVGALIRFPEIGSAVFFMPYAALVAVLVASPRRHWPWYLAAAALCHDMVSVSGWPLTWVLLADLANVVRALTAALLLIRIFRGVPMLEDIRSLALFVVVGVVIAPAVGATIGAVNAIVHDVPQSYARMWVGWYVSNALTGLTVLPGFLVAVGNWQFLKHRRWSRGRMLEAVILIVATVVIGALAFLPRYDGNRTIGVLFYAPGLPVLWLALRFGAGGASVGMSIVTVLGILGAGRGSGPFRYLPPDENLLTLQLFLGLTTIPLLCIAAVDSARTRAVQLYRSVLSSLDDQVAILDARGRVFVVNESWQRFASSGHICPLEGLQVGDDALVACQQVLRASEPDFERKQFTRRLHAGLIGVLSGEEKRIDLEYENPVNGERAWFTLRVEPRQHSDRGAVMTRSNVTERRRTQLELDDQRRALAHLARVGMLGQLSGALAHELRQPLTSILANAEAVRHMLERNPHDMRPVNAALHDIMSQNRRAANVIDGLRAMLKRGEARVQPIDPSVLVHEVLEIAHAELVSRGVTATAVVSADIPPLLADRVQLQQVLLNLILNGCEAMDALPRSARRLEVAVAPTPSGDVCLSVRDVGPGIPDALIGRLFEPFVTNKPDGLGLGLSIARTIVAAHGGRIWAENNSGAGATVHCVFVSAKTTGPAREPLAAAVLA